MMIALRFLGWVVLCSLIYFCIAVIGSITKLNFSYFDITTWLEPVRFVYALMVLAAALIFTFTSDEDLT